MIKKNKQIYLKQFSAFNIRQRKILIYPYKISHVIAFPSETYLQSKKQKHDRLQYEFSFPIAV